MAERSSTHLHFGGQLISAATTRGRGCWRRWKRTPPSCQPVGVSSATRWSGKAGEASGATSAQKCCCRRNGRQRPSQLKRPCPLRRNGGRCSVRSCRNEVRDQK